MPHTLKLKNTYTKAIEVAARHVPKHRIIASTNCGMAPMRRDIAYAKLAALSRGAALARARLG